MKFSKGEERILLRLIERVNESTRRANDALDEALRSIDASMERIERIEEEGRMVVEAELGLYTKCQ